MSVLLGLLTAHEREGLDTIAGECGDRFRPQDAVNVSRTTCRTLAKLGLLETTRGRRDNARMIRLSKVALDALCTTDALKGEADGKAKV